MTSFDNERYIQYRQNASASDGFSPIVNRGSEGATQTGITQLDKFHEDYI